MISFEFLLVVLNMCLWRNSETRSLMLIDSWSSRLFIGKEIFPKRYNMEWIYLTLYIIYGSSSLVKNIWKFIVRSNYMEVHQFLYSLVICFFSQPYQTRVCKILFSFASDGRLSAKYSNLSLWPQDGNPATLMASFHNLHRYLDFHHLNISS
jgi:hypothetical protein